MTRIDDRIIKAPVNKERRADGLEVHPFNFLANTPPRDCVFDSFHGTIGLDVFPFSVTTRINACNQIFLKVYEED